MLCMIRMSTVADTFIHFRCVCLLRLTESKGWRGCHAENFLVLGLFGLIFHDLIVREITKCGLRLMDFPFHYCIHNGVRLSKSHPALSLRQKMLNRIQLLDKMKVRAAHLTKGNEAKL